MSLDPFANLELRLNKAVARRLANAVATFKGGDPFGVLFDLQAVTPIDMVESAGPVAAFEAAFAPGLVYGDLLVINGEPFRAVGGLEPDSSGWLSLRLQREA